MPVEISILSGARQGDVIQLPDAAFEVGSLASDSVGFDPQADPGIVGRRASLRPGPDGWLIRSTGSLPISINYDVLKAASALRSGDIVRMSEDGPDFVFALIARIVPSESPVCPAEVSPPPQPATPVDGPTVSASEPELATEPMPVAPPHPSLSVSPRELVLGGGIVAALLVGVLVLFSLMWRDQATDLHAASAARFPKLSPINAIAIDEGRPLIWRPTILERAAEGSVVRFKLGDPKPAGMEIDPATGTIRWVPTEEQGPQEVRLSLVIESLVNGASESMSETLFIVVNEVNELPIIEPLSRHTVNLRADAKLAVQVTARDSDLPPQQLVYSLAGDVPSGMVIHARSGAVTWRASDGDVGKEFGITILVSDNAAPPRVAKTELFVSVIAPDPLDYAAEQISGAVYLVGAQPVGLESFYPLGTACAVTDHLLVTNAAVAIAVAKAEQVKWSIVVVPAASISQRHEMAIPIVRTNIHRAYAATDDAAMQTFFDLGLLTVRDTLPASCPLASDRELAELSINQTIGCFGFTFEEAALTRFDSPSPSLNRVKFKQLLLPDEDPRAPARLLEVVGEVPPLAYGSVIISPAGKLLGIYSLPGQLPDGEEANIQLHYAPVVTLVAMRIADQTTEPHWVVPTPPVVPVVEQAN